jgi:hypothetical protein
MNEILISVKPLYIIGKIFGFMPFKLLENGEVKTSIFSIVHGIGIFFTLNLILLLRIEHGDDYHQQGSLLSKFTLICAMFFCVSFAVITILLNFLNRDRFHDLIRSLWKFDNELKRFGKSPNYPQHRNVFVKILTIAFVVFTVQVFMPWFIHGVFSKIELEETLAGIVTINMWCGINLYLTVSCISVLTITYRFSLVGEMLVSVLRHRVSGLTRVHVMTLGRLHMEMCRTVEIFNRTFSFPMAMLLGVNMMVRFGIVLG